MSRPSRPSAKNTSLSEGMGRGMAQPLPVLWTRKKLAQQPLLHSRSQIKYQALRANLPLRPGRGMLSIRREGSQLMVFGSWRSSNIFVLPYLGHSRNPYLQERKVWCGALKGSGYLKTHMLMFLVMTYFRISNYNILPKKELPGSLQV